MALVILFGLLKIALILLFLLTTAGALTWAERRQSAMIQDRLGPNRASVHLPTPLVQGAIAAIGVAAAGGCAVSAYVVRRPAPLQTDWCFGLMQLAILATWIGVAVARRAAAHSPAPSGLGNALARIRDPRSIFYAGLCVHAFALSGWLALPKRYPQAVVLGKAPLVPGSSLESALRHVFAAGPAWLTLVLLVGTFWTVSRVPAGGVGLRAIGLLHLIADGMKMAFKEDFIPPHADRLLHALGPIIALFPALVTFAVVPFGDTLCLESVKDGSLWEQLASLRLASMVPRSGVCAENGIPLQIASLNVGILYMFALAGTGIIGAAIAGYSSDNKFSLLGALRASSQMVSYEVAMGLTLVGAFMVYGTVRLEDMVRWQAEHAWGIFVQPVAFVLFLAAANAEQKRVPFDAPEGESEIVAGYFVEYSGMKWAMFYLGEYIEIVVSSALLATIFFGGWALPFVHRDGLTLAFGNTVVLQLGLQHWGVILIGVMAFFGKVLLLCWAQLFIRWTVPRFRYDQVMSVGWRMLLPGALLNMFVTGVVLVALDHAGEGTANALSFLGDVTQAVLAVGGLIGVIVGVSKVLTPAPERARVVSTASAYAAAKGGTKMSPMQA